MNHRRATPFCLVAAALIIGCGATPLDPPLADADLTPGEDAAALIDTQTTPTEDTGSPVVVDGGSPVVDAITPTFDVGAPPRDVVIPVRDTGEGAFCPRALCMVGSLCCESLQRCLPPGERCPDDPPPPIDAGPARDVGVMVDVPRVDASTRRCGSARECGTGSECVFQAEACVRDGVCMAAIACLRAETFCACSGETYTGCRPDRPTSSRGRCAAVDAGPAACRSDAECERRAYCNADTCGGAGTCVARPEICTREYAPVCGCDGETYGNACAAASAGVRVASRGECAAVDAGTLRCNSSRECGAGRECVFQAEACVRDGFCSAAIACFRPETFCSCSGETYQSCRPDRPTISRGACAAFDAGAAACRSNDDCGRGSYCAGDVCGTAGTCAERPGACIEIYSPVCGCDGRTYPNSCYAAAGGARVRSRGACADRL